MLKRLRVDNFKSLINVVFEPARVNLLTGRNNSGKTTLCQAMVFIRQSAASPVVAAVSSATSDPWNLTNVYFQKDNLEFECDCMVPVDGQEIDFSYSLSLASRWPTTPGVLSRECEVLEERLTASGGRFQNKTSLLENDAGRVRLLHEGKHSRKDSEPYVETTAPTDTTMLNRLYDLQDNKYANAFKRYIAGWQYYDFDSASLRTPDAKEPELALQPDGSNLSHLLYRLKSVDERRYRTFLDVARDVEPKLDALNFVAPTQESVYMMLTDSRNNRFLPPSISNGTLRFMAIAYIAIIAAMMADTRSSPAPLIIIEEPENGIYAGLLRRIMELVAVPAANAPQFVFTSHSPYFINLFDAHLDGIFVMKSDGTHSDLVKPDMIALEKVLEHFDLGDAHFRELLG